MRYVYLFIKTLQRYKNYFNYAKNGATYLRHFPCFLCPRAPAPCVLVSSLLCVLVLSLLCVLVLVHSLTSETSLVKILLLLCHIVTLSQ